MACSPAREPLLVPPTRSAQAANLPPATAAGTMASPGMTRSSRSGLLPHSRFELVEIERHRSGDFAGSGDFASTGLGSAVGALDSSAFDSTGFDSELLESAPLGAGDRGAAFGVAALSSGTAAAAGFESDGFDAAAFDSCGFEDCPWAAFADRRFQVGGGLRRHRLRLLGLRFFVSLYLFGAPSGNFRSAGFVSVAFASTGFGSVTTLASGGTCRLEACGSGAFATGVSSGEGSSLNISSVGNKSSRSSSNPGSFRSSARHGGRFGLGALRRGAVRGSQRRILGGGHGRLGKIEIIEQRQRRQLIEIRKRK